MSDRENNNTESDNITEIKQPNEAEDINHAGERVEGMQEELTEDLEVLRNNLEKEKEQAKSNLEMAFRAQAEMENLRKRTTRDIENAHKYALEKLINELLPVLDSMELGINAVGSGDNMDDLRKGMELTLKMFKRVLEKFGVIMVAAEDVKFDPEEHEAISMQNIEEKESGTIISVVQKGYKLNGRLVRPAMVIVAK